MREKKVLIIQHVPWEGPGSIVSHLDDHDVPVTIRHLADMRDTSIAPLTDLAGLVLMGGPMGARDTRDHPGLAAEAQLVREAIDVNIPVLGVCLGHQIIATALGADLLVGDEPEHGVGPVRVFENRAGFGPAGKDRHVLHWHNDQVTLPHGATLLAGSEATPNQAFQYGSAVGVQFHLEIDTPTVNAWLDNTHMCVGLSGEQTNRIRHDYEQYRAEIAVFAGDVFGTFAAAVAANVVAR